MKLLLLAASLVVLGGCVASDYDYVRPDYSGTGYYDDGYGGGYDGSGYYGSSYYPEYYGGCCGSVGVSIGYGYGGYGYGYPGPYGYPYGYYTYPNGYYYGHHGDHHDHHHDGGGWDGGGSGDHDDDDPAQPWRQPDHPPMPRHNNPEALRWSAPEPQMISPGVQPHVTPRFAPRSPSGAGGHSTAPVRTSPPPRPGTPPPKKL